MSKGSSESRVGMTKSGFCQWPAQNGNSHELCITQCDCDCHTERAESD